MVWHGGLSGSAPLKVAEPGHFLEGKIGVVGLGQTLGSWMNLGITGALVVVIPLTLWWMLPRDEARWASVPEAILARDEAPGGAERWGWLGRGAGLWVVCGVVWAVGSGGMVWGLDAINLGFFGLGLALHRGPGAYMAAVGEGVRGCAGVIAQFPLYFGIVGVLKVSGLAGMMAGWFVAVSSAQTLAVWTFLSAGLLNMLIPSGGGQWAVQGPVMVEAALRLGVEPARVVMALAYGDAWTNMLQPFWALPLLGVMGLEARQILGYTTVVMCVTGPVIVAGLLFL
jgi:short-chain fatty acids transporter